MKTLFLQDKICYRRHLELALILALMLMLFVFSAFKRFDARVTVHKPFSKPLEVIPVPRTIQPERIRMPEKPAVPIAGEDADLPEDATITTTDFYSDLAFVLPPPELNQDEVSSGPFEVFDKPPSIVGGYAELARKLIYPELARKAGIEGNVIVNVLIDRDGRVLATKVMRSLGNNGCDEAAIKAIKSVKWNPAFQRDKPVKVWVSIKVAFVLR